MNNLPEIITDEMQAQGLTYRDVSTNAERRGFSIGHSTVYGYAKGTAKKYKREHLEAIAAGLGISVETLINAAGLPRQHEPFLLPEESELLTPEEREAVRGVVKTMIETRKQVMGNAQHPAPNTDAAGTAAADDEKVTPLPHRSREYRPPWEERDAAFEPGEYEEGIDPDQI